MWNGKSKPNPRLIRLFKKGELIPACCEQLGGLPTPRTPSGILNAIGLEVINGDGALTALGKANGLKICSEREI